MLWGGFSMFLDISLPPSLPLSPSLSLSLFVDTRSVVREQRNRKRLVSYSCLLLYVYSLCSPCVCLLKKHSGIGILSQVVKVQLREHVHDMCMSHVVLYTCVHILCMQCILWALGGWEFQLLIIRNCSYSQYYIGFRY